MDWTAIKDLIGAWTGLERDALHIYAALLIQIGAAWLLRRTLADALPWLFVLAVEIANELIDLFGDRLVEPWEIEAARHDLWNTMLIPTSLFLLARFAPRLVARRPDPAPPPSEPGQEEEAAELKR